MAVGFDILVLRRSLPTIEAASPKKNVIVTAGVCQVAGFQTRIVFLHMRSQHITTPTLSRLRCAEQKGLRWRRMPGPHSQVGDRSNGFRV